MPDDAPPTAEPPSQETGTAAAAEDAAAVVVEEPVTEAQYEFSAPKFHDFERVSSDSSSVADG